MRALTSGSGRGNPKIFGCVSCTRSWTPLSKFLDPPLKHLGIWITSNLSWSKQVNEVCYKARQKVSILFWKHYQHTSTSTLLKFYLSCIRPDLEYGVVVWSPHQKCLIKSLESVQTFALQVYSRQWDTNYHTLLARYNIPSLSNRQLLLRLCFQFMVLTVYLTHHLLT